MSLLRQRAIVRSAVSSLRVRRPPDARAWFCSVISCDSDPELMVFSSQPRTVGARYSPADELSARARATATATRRVAPCRSERRWSGVNRIMRMQVSQGARRGFRVSLHARSPSPSVLRRKGPARTRPRYQSGPDGSRPLPEVGYTPLAPWVDARHERDTPGNLVALAQWQSIGLWLRRLRVRAP